MLLAGIGDSRVGRVSHVDYSVRRGEIVVVGAHWPGGHWGIATGRRQCAGTLPYLEGLLALCFFLMACKHVLMGLHALGIWMATYCWYGALEPAGL